MADAPPSPPERLRLIGGLTVPAIREAVRVFGPEPASHGLDAGCGVGSHLALLSQGMSEEGSLTALDISDENLNEARAAWQDSGRRIPPVSFVQGDIARIPFAADTFDWVWCADTLWPGAAVEDPVPVVVEFRRALKPGGRVALVYWSGQTLLPGHPGLEARLNARAVELMPYLAGVAPGRHFLRALDWLREAGVARPQAAAFVADIRSDGTPRFREALAMCLAMLWDGAAGGLDSGDREAYARLCLPDSPDFIGDLSGYYGMISYTMFWGRFAAPTN